MKQISLILGDHSGDGHSKTYKYIINSNLSKDKILSAFDKGCEKIDISFDYIANYYEDPCLNYQDYEKFQRFPEAPVLTSDYEDKELSYIEYLKLSDDEKYNCFAGYILYNETFLNFWLFTVKVGNPKFKYSFAEKDDTNINIGGYGLFY